MIIYDETITITNEFDSIIKKEIALLDKFQLSQNSLIDYINEYVKKISTTFSNDEIFKNMLLASLETASLQIGINMQDLTNLYNILDIILSDKTSIKENVEQYNKLFAKVEKNVNIVEEIFQKTKNSFEQLSSLSNKKAIPSQPNSEKQPVAKHAVVKKENLISEKKTASRNIKKFEDNASSDFLCFFPKSDNDILAISTVQDTYKVTFHEELTTVCIEEDDFNFTLKTIGVQISNSANVLLISRENPGYFIITNMPIDVPSYINVSRIERNKNFIEIGVTNSSLSVRVTKNELTFLDEFEIKCNNEHDNIISVSPTVDEPFPKRLSEIQTQTVVAQATSAQSAKDIFNETIKDSVTNTLEPSLALEDSNNVDFTKDNDTLIISEEDNQIILPYKLEEVERQYKKNRKKYSSVQELIENEYIIPKDNFKNPVKSRFREAYHLVKKKEHGHLKEALELGFELMFQSNLNPAVIAACKNLKELDIYLDCLDDNELDKFSCFNIVYNVPPALSKKKKK